MQQIVLPIKDSNVLKMVQDTLLDSFRAGRRNYTIFQVGKATLLRVSDVMTLKKSDVYNPDGSVKHTAFIQRVSRMLCKKGNFARMNWQF